jgi:coenzyme F420-0:L-glutamate ligase / coenzyme F420-1:gamma-L-glutamate ligase
MNKDLHQFLRSRRSIRIYKKDPVSSEIIHKILETAVYAPSAHNLQPWRFLILTASNDKSRLAEALAGKFRQDMINDAVPEKYIQVRVGSTIRRTREAPVIIILCRDKKEVKLQPDAVRTQVETLMAIQSVALAGLQLLLAAHAEGLGAAWICWPLFAPEEIRHVLGLASDWEPQGMFFLGYPDESPEMPARLSLQEVTRFL